MILKSFRRFGWLPKGTLIVYIYRRFVLACLKTPIITCIEEEPGPSGLILSVFENSASYRPSQKIRNLLVCTIFSRQLVLQLEALSVSKYRDITMAFKNVFTRTAYNRAVVQATEARIKEDVARDLQKRNTTEN